MCTSYTWCTVLYSTVSTLLPQPIFLLLLFLSLYQVNTGDPRHFPTLLLFASKSESPLGWSELIFFSFFFRGGGLTSFSNWETKLSPDRGQNTADSRSSPLSSFVSRSQSQLGWSATFFLTALSLHLDKISLLTEMKREQTLILLHCHCSCGSFSAWLFSAPFFYCP